MAFLYISYLEMLNATRICNEWCGSVRPTNFLYPVMESVEILSRTERLITLKLRDDRDKVISARLRMTLPLSELIVFDMGETLCIDRLMDEVFPSVWLIIWVSNTGFY